MSLQFGSTPIGAMQYNGVTIGEAIMDGVIVYRSSPYPLTGTWESALTTSTTTYAEHTIEADGSYTLTHTVTGGGQYVGAAINGPWGTTNSPPGPPSTATVTQTLAAGDLIKFQAGALIPSGTASGSWSIVKN